MCIIMTIIYITISEVIIIGYLQNQYNYYRKIYKLFMPDKIVFKEKKIKFWLVKYDVLNK